MIMVINTEKLKIILMRIFVQKKQIFFNEKNKYFPQVFSEECLHRYIKCFEIIIINK